MSMSMAISYEENLKDFIFLDEVINIIRSTGDFLIYYFSIPFMVIILIGNGLNFIVFMNKKFQSSSTTFYLLALALIDMLTIINILCFHLYGMKLILIITFDGHPLVAKVCTYLNSTIPFYSSWVSVLIAFDRFMSTCSVKLMKTLKNKKLQLLLVFSIIVFLSIINVDLLIDAYGVYPYENSFQTGSTSRLFSFPAFYINIFPYLDMIVTSILPFILMCTFNIATVVTLKRSKIISGVIARQLRKKNKNENRLLKISMWLNVLFFIACAPLSIMQIWNNSRDSTHIVSGVNGFFMAMYYQLYIIAFYWRALYPASQFLMHMCVNSVYKNILKNKIKSLFRFCKRN